MPKRMFLGRFWMLFFGLISDLIFALILNLNSSILRKNSDFPLGKMLLFMKIRVDAGTFRRHKNCRKSMPKLVEKTLKTSGKSSP